MQQVLGYSPIRAGLAFLVIAAGMIASSALAQHLVTRLGVKAVLTTGLLGLAAAQVLFLRLPAAGSYAADLLPGFVIVAAALGLAMVSDVIAAAAGVQPADAGLASGLINTSRQIGGAIGVAVTTAIAAARTASMLRAGHPRAAALTAGFHGAFAVTSGLALASALVSVSLIGRVRPAASPEAPTAYPAPAATSQTLFRGKRHDS
jgi:predicted MFS family arabinose efflux permease